VVIRNTGKEDYTKLKSYRMISLFRWDGKVVDNVVAELLSDKDKKIPLLIDCSFGSRMKWLPIDAAPNMVSRIHSAWKEDIIPYNKGQADRFRSDTVDRERTLRAVSGDGNRRQTIIH
jgi:hypothetical protein